VPRWLVDGMNVIGSRPDGWWRDREAAKRRLVEELAAFARGTGDEVAVIFDGKPFELEPSAIEVAFASTRGPNAADHDIADRAEADPVDLRVVTSDGALADRVRAAGAEVEGAGGFRRRLDRA
jgi:predicted RNA-binding protein with PIN domain